MRQVRKAFGQTYLAVHSIDNFREFPLSDRDKAYYSAPLLMQTNGQLDPRCYLAINRLKKGPADYKTILGSGKPYTDPDFKAD